MTARSSKRRQTFLLQQGVEPAAVAALELFNVLAASLAAHEPRARTAERRLVHVRHADVAARAARAVHDGFSPSGLRVQIR